jgi:hypothetical protein
MTADQFYRACLVVFPREFRQQYGDAMVEAFREFHSAIPRRGLGFWLFVGADTCRSACIEQISAWTSRPRRLALQWIGGCALGAAASGALGSRCSIRTARRSASWCRGSAFDVERPGGVALCRHESSERLLIPDGTCVDVPSLA